MGKAKKAKKAKVEDAKPPYHGILSVLFETPSGFAIFHCCESLIEDKDVMEVLWHDFTKNCNAYLLVWRKQFKSFKDKSSAITQNAGVNKRLSQMIEECHYQGMKLAVAKPQYKEIIEKSLNISCVHGPAVMELMWGIQNCMKLFLPMEKKKLTEADRLPISQGLHTFLSRYGCVVKPEQVSEQIVNAASALFWCESVEKENGPLLRSFGSLIEHVSGIDCNGWSLLKLATAMKAIWCPEEIGDSCEEIPEGEFLRLVEKTDKYDFYLDKFPCLGTAEVMMSAHDVRTTNENLLKSLAENCKSPEA